jgi:hypothetical protein
MRFAFYCGVLLVAAASVAFGLDWMSAPMPPMPDVKNVVFVPPPPPPPPRVAQPVVTPPPPPASTTASPPPSRAAAAPPSAPQTPTAEVPPAPPVAAAPRPKCDVDACARAYRSFQESDCTYNPSSGPRRLCTKGDPEKYAREHAEPAAPAPVATPATPAAEPTAEAPGSIVAPEAGATPATPTATAPAHCNVSACAAAYPRSFRESDCTFNPSSGPRKVCAK